MTAISIINDWLKPGNLELKAGEMTAQERRTVKAVLIAIRGQIELEDKEREITPLEKSR